MKVLLLNGSPHPKGCVYTALMEISNVLKKEDIETELIQMGTQPVRGCIACRKCKETGRCVFGEDAANIVLEKMEEADGLIVGSPVYYASANGSLISLLDRVFYAGRKELFAYKPAAFIAAARRAGSTATLDELNKYFSISQMPVVSSTYWNMVHGNCPEEVLQDKEGLQTMRNLARNMAWLLRCLEAGKKSGVARPESEQGSRTNFIR